MEAPRWGNRKLSEACEALVAGRVAVGGIIITGRRQLASLARRLGLLPWRNADQVVCYPGGKEYSQQEYQGERVAEF